MSDLSLQEELELLETEAFEILSIPDASELHQSVSSCCSGGSTSSCCSCTSSSCASTSSCT